LLDVVEVLDDAEQVAALVALDSRRAIPGLQVVRLLDLVALCEAVGEDLVEDGVLDPVGGMDGSHT
jgi:hypothetical protein